MSTADEHLEKTRGMKEHIEGEANGCLIRCYQYGRDDVKGLKGHSHRHNGREYQKNNEAELYNLNFTEEPNKSRLESVFGSNGPSCLGGNPKNDSSVWHIEGSNFFSAKLPWPNAAHHVIPLNIVAKVFPKVEELQLLLVAKYNVNRGLNIVLLPFNYEYGHVMGLPVHRGSHGDYDLQVETKLNSIRRAIKKAEDPQRKDHPELTPGNVGGITSDIETFAKRLRKLLLRRAGGVHVNHALKLIFPRGL